MPRERRNSIRHDAHAQLFAVVAADRARVERPAVDVEMLGLPDVVVRDAFVAVFAGAAGLVDRDAEQRVDADGEHVGERDEVLEFGAAGAALPFGDRLPGDADAVRELLLRESRLPAQVLEFCREIHGCLIPFLAFSCIAVVLECIGDIYCFVSAWARPTSLTG